MRTMLMIAAGLLGLATVAEPATAQRYDGHRNGWHDGRRYDPPRRYRDQRRYYGQRGYHGRPSYQHGPYRSGGRRWNGRRANVVCRTSWWNGRRVQNCRRTFY